MQKFYQHDHNSNKKVKYVISGSGSNVAFNEFNDVLLDINKTRPIRPWSQNRAKYWLKTILNFLLIASGNNLLPLINDLVNCTCNGNTIFNQLSALNPYQDTLHKLQQANANDDKHVNKWKILKYVTAFDKKTLKAMGFDCGVRSISNARRTLAQNKNIPVESKPKIVTRTYT